MDFRELLNTIDVLSEGKTLTLATLIASIGGYSQDDSIRYPIVAKMARDYGFAGLVDPSKGMYIPADWEEMGDEEDEVPMEEVKKLSAAGLLPQGAKLPQAGWFDDDDVYAAANAHWTDQSGQIAGKHNEITSIEAKQIQLKNQLATLLRSLQQQGYKIPPQLMPYLNPNSTPAEPPPSLGSDSMDNKAKKLFPDRPGSSLQPTLAEAIIRSMDEDFDWKGAADSASDYAQTFGRNFWNGATYGAGPETYGAAKSYANDTRAKDEIQQQRNLLAQSKKEHPYLSTAAELAGGFASPISKLGVAKSIATGAGIGAATYGADKALGVGEETAEETTADFQNWLNSKGANLELSGKPDQETIDAINTIILGAKP